MCKLTFGGETSKKAVIPEVSLLEHKSHLQLLKVLVALRIPRPYCGLALKFSNLNEITIGNVTMALQLHQGLNQSLSTTGQGMVQVNITNWLRAVMLVCSRVQSVASLGITICTWLAMYLLFSLFTTWTMIGKHKKSDGWLSFVHHNHWYKPMLSNNVWLLLLQLWYKFQTDDPVSKHHHSC